MWRLALAAGLLSLAVQACGEAPGGTTFTPPASSEPTTFPATATAEPATAASGIEGQVLIGPACPGPESVTSPCPDQPYQAAVQVLDAAGALAAEFQSDANGRFRVALPPGSYTLRPLSPGVLPRAGELPVTVISGQYTSVTITYDSGMR